MAKRDHQIDVEDIPHLLATLGCGTENAQQRVLRLLCPCRNRVYDVEVWMAIFRTYDSRTDDTDLVRHRAKHAIDTLRKQARTNPFSPYLLNLVKMLAEQGIHLNEQKESLPAPKGHTKIALRAVPHIRRRRPVTSRRARATRFLHAP